MTTALHEAGYTLTEREPDYVVLGETRTYSFESITRAIRLIAAGARFIATNPDATGPSAEGPLPATGSVAALISRATGVEPYYVGKPNPLMMRSALNALDVHSETTAMIGDRMDTDVVAGLEAGLEHGARAHRRDPARGDRALLLPRLADRRVGRRARRRAGVTRTPPGGTAPPVRSPAAAQTAGHGRRRPHLTPGPRGGARRRPGRGGRARRCSRRAPCRRPTSRAG